MQDKDGGFGFFDFLRHVITDAQKRSNGEKGKCCLGHLSDGDERCLEDEGQAFFARGQIRGDSRPQGTAKEYDSSRIDLFSVAQVF